MLRLKSLNDPALVKMLEDGAVGVLPTDTIYGIACRAADGSAVEQLYKLKERERKPGTVIAASTQQLIDLGIPARYLNAAKQYWPNPVSIETPHDLAYLHQDTRRQAFRVVKNQEVQNLLAQTGPLLTSSANDPGKPPANTIQEAEKYFGDQVDFYVDGGDLSGRPPSTIIKVVDDEVVVVRQGAVKINELGEVIR